MDSYSATQDVGGSIGGAFDDLDSTPSLGDYSSVSSLDFSLPLSTTTSSSTGSTLVPPTYSFTSSSQMPTPSLPLPPPSSAPSIQPMQARPSTPPPPPSSQPRTRLPAASLLRAAAKPLRMTTQMNSDWMEANGASSTTPIHIHRASTNRNFVDARLVKRFHLVSFITPGKSPLAQVIDECATWPTWQVSEAGDDDVGQLVEGLAEHAKLDVYDPDRRLWFAIKLSTPHRLTPGCTIFLRRRDPGWDDAEIEAVVAKYLPPPAPHMRYNLAAERKAVRKAYKQLKTASTQRPSTRTTAYHPPSPSLSPSLSATPSPSPSPSPMLPSLPLMIDDEVPSSAMLTDDDLPSKRTFDEMDNSSEPRHVRPRLTISTDIASFPSTLTTPALSATLSSAPPSAGPSTPLSTTAPLPFAAPKGFAGMYVVDIVAGFNAIDAGTGDLATRFETVFPGRRYKQVTYHENHRKWREGSAQLRDATLKAGRTKAGLWRAYTL
ncbi:hypothetical protein C8F01DRAFT_1261610 [Mycena amicta]|nr:hypothetical protein C8F01DRAFT_1261610 [Mycena amicta]